MRLRPPRPILLALTLLLGASRVPAADPAPVIFRTAPGRFEIVAADVSAAREVTSLAEDAWQHLAAPLALPESFSSPVFVRLTPAAGLGDAAPFRTVVEAGGVVSVWIRWGEVNPEPFIRRALVQGLLLRLAVAQHGVHERITAPLWLEHACVGWWRTRANPARLDALKQQTAVMAPPALASLLGWQRSGEETEAQSIAAFWLLTFLQSESARTGEWPSLLNRLLAGDDPEAALAATFPGRYASIVERELWWQTGWHHLRRVRTLPVLGVAESRVELAALARFVFAGEENDRIVPLRAVLEHAQEPIVYAEVIHHAEALGRLIPALHPFYRNAGLSLAEVLASRAATAARREPLCRTFERDFADAVELETAAGAALDALERRPPP